MNKIMTEIAQASRLKNEIKDCAVRSTAIATDYEYDDIHELYNICGRKPRHSTDWCITKKVIHLLRHRIVDVTHHLKSRTVRTLEREMQGTQGRYLVQVREHILPIVDGCVYDWSKGHCNHIRSVYRLIEVSEEFHHAEKRPVLYLPALPADISNDVTPLYKRLRKAIPPGYDKVFLVKDNEGPVFVEVKSALQLV
jgi:hypothetical protein